MKYLPGMRGIGTMLENYTKINPYTSEDQLGKATPKLDQYKKMDTFFGNYFKDKFMADVSINLNAPKGTVKNYSSVTEGTGLNLGLNMGF